jgi:hypothetical protein
MTFEMDCPHCQRKLNVSEKAFGKTVSCPGCNQPIKILQPAARPPSPRPAQPYAPMGGGTQNAGPARVSPMPLPPGMPSIPGRNPPPPPPPSDPWAYLISDAEPAPASPPLPAVMPPAPKIAALYAPPRVAETAPTCPRCGITNQDAGDTGTLVILRKAATCGSFHSVQVTVDEQPRGEVKDGGVLRIELPTGAHFVQVGGGGLSRTATITIDKGQTLRCQTYFSAWGALGGGLNF